ncbi:hypothetical protein BC939DRAFT_482043 [Gamsiella multidivaricata]|uniref:uncharacterized protein n=1 Tax=Gamsiella multidivaricata TaxID=101098 RepID=UPI00221E896C|nr:uncharacterized protein BC939DRAFT_482043 [Gamsiella multidivaricata]KAI7816435.1 hypothetical protein BC939DRAFT_482043 [Gamsiella multidivaricata]
MNDASLVLLESSQSMIHYPNTLSDIVTTATATATLASENFKETLVETTSDPIKQRRLDRQNGEELKIQATVKVAPDMLCDACTGAQPRFALTTIATTDTTKKKQLMHQGEKTKEKQQQTLGQQMHSPSRQHFSHSYTHHHRLPHHHQQHLHQQCHNAGNGHFNKKHKNNKRFSYSKVGIVPSNEHSQGHLDRYDEAQDKGQQKSAVADEGFTGKRIRRAENGSWGLLVDPTLKCCSIRTPQLLTISTTPCPQHGKQQCPSRTVADPSHLSPSSSSSTPSSDPLPFTVNSIPSPKTPSIPDPSTSPSSAPEKHRAGPAGNCTYTKNDYEQQQEHQRYQHGQPDRDHSTHSHGIQSSERPRVCKMLVKHPAVKLDWRLPEPVKAGGEMLRGVLVISARELTESELKTKKTLSKNKKRKEAQKQSLYDNRIVHVEHIEVDLIGVEEVTTGAGLLSRARAEQHCFLHKTQVLPLEELKWVHGTSSSSSSSASSSSTPASTSASASPSSDVPIAPSFIRTNTHTSATSALDSPTSEVPESFQSGCIAPGTCQGISFQMRVPEKVSGTFKSAHASISYQLTANVHIRLGKEMFVLQHPLPVSLFELVQICAATKTASPCGIGPEGPLQFISNEADVRRSPTYSTISTSSGTSKTSSSVRFVILKANSVLGTAVVKPYSLWGLGPATSSQHHHYTYSNSHGYGRYRHQRSHSHEQSRRHHHQQHQRQRSFQSTTAVGPGSSVAAGNSLFPFEAQTMMRSQTAMHAMGSLQLQLQLSEEKVSAASHNTCFQDDGMISAEDPYRQQQLKQRKMELEQYTSGRTRQSNMRRKSSDGLDEVGFGAHIDKSVVAAGDQVTLDMFIVKSDLMKVVDIKVSLVETIQVFSLLDHDDACAVVSPIASRARMSEEIEGAQEVMEKNAAAKETSRRKLVDTHVVKIAKDYVPAQSEESHANDNHLKGYYEDYEDFRTAKSLSVYKLSMRIPENALTILERELMKVEYMFVIKFFFKGRMGAFLELPIEIVSQYNHNRISTISGAISCVSNSVQIAMPPVPILIKRIESQSPDLSAMSTLDRLNLNKEIATSDADNGAEVKAPDSDDSSMAEKDEDMGSTEKDFRAADVTAIDVKESHKVLNLPESTAGEQSQDKAASSKDPEDTPKFIVNIRSSSLKAIQDKFSGISSKDQVVRATLMDSNKKVTSVSRIDLGLKQNSSATKREIEGTVSSSRLSKMESEAFKSNVARIAAVFMGKESSITPKVPLRYRKSEGSTVILKGGDAIPKITVNSTKTFVKNNNSNRHPPHDKDSLSRAGSAPCSPASFHGSDRSSSIGGTSSISVQPALPLLFDLTSAALPSPSAQVMAFPDALKSLGGGDSASSNSVTSSEMKMTTPIVMCSSPVSELFGSGAAQTKGVSSSPRQQQPSYGHQNMASNFRSLSASSTPRDDDSSSCSSDSRSNHGLVAKIAKSLSSPLLRARGSISPNGSNTNLSLLSPQQQSTAFTLAATTLSALTLLSSVGHTAAVMTGEGANNINDSGNGSHGGAVLRRRRLSQTSQLPPPRPLKSCLKKRRVVSLDGANGLKTFAPLRRKKVTFAKGSTPAPSPRASQVSFPDLEYHNHYQHLMQGNGTSTSPAVPVMGHPGTFSAAGVNMTFGRSAAAASPLTTSPSFSPVNRGMSDPHSNVVLERPLVLTQRTRSSITAMTTQQHQSLGNGVTTIARSPSSASPRARLHHPFDSHPSRLSPLEKQHLDFQIKVQSPVRIIRTDQDLSSRDHRNGEDADVQEEDEDEDEEEEDMEYDDDEDEDDEDDDQETEEERVERRRQARVAWLSKYGDAFKQVYGAVPELPPI